MVEAAGRSVDVSVGGIETFRQWVEAHGHVAPSLRTMWKSIAELRRMGLLVHPSRGVYRIATDNDGNDSGSEVQEGDSGGQESQGSPDRAAGN